MMIDKDIDKWYRWQVSTKSALSCNKNHALWKRNTYSSYTVDTVAADKLATQGARASVAMVLTCLFFRNIHYTEVQFITLLKTKTLQDIR